MKVALRTSKDRRESEEDSGTFSPFENTPMLDSQFRTPT